MTRRADRPCLRYSASLMPQPSSGRPRSEIWDLKLGMSVDRSARRVHRLCLRQQRRPAVDGAHRLARLPALPAGAGRPARGLFPLRRRARILGQGQQFRDRDQEISPAPRCSISRSCCRRASTSNGILEGIRIVSDPRDTSRDREEAYLLRNFLTARYGREDWDCVDLPPEDGETPVFRTFIKQRCKKTVEGGALAELAHQLSAQEGPGRDRSALGPARPKASSKAWCASS